MQSAARDDSATSISRRGLRLGKCPRNVSVSWVVV